jgi:osmotically-inducible protein OsmY
MKSDDDIKRDVEAELQWDPEIDATDITVAVKDGVVTLAGFVVNYWDKEKAEAAAKRVAGVVGVANDIEVRILGTDQRPDPIIARDVVAAIRFEFPHVEEDIRVVVKDGWVTLEGEVEWNYVRERAEAALRRVKGIKGITNLIRLKPRTEPIELKRKIEEALERIANLDESGISVEVYGSTVILEGTVPSWWDRKQAERAAWAAPGVQKVENRLLIKPPL